MRKGTELILVFGDIMGLISTYIYNNIFNVAQLQLRDVDIIIVEFPV